MRRWPSAPRRRAADGVNENLAARDQRDSQRAVAPLMIALGAKVINNSAMTSEQTSAVLLEEIRPAGNCNDWRMQRNSMPINAPPLRISSIHPTDILPMNLLSPRLDVLSR